MARKDIHTLKELMAVKRGILLPGVPNALAARAVVDVGFEAIYLNGALVSPTCIWDYPIWGLSISASSSTTQWRSEVSSTCRLSLMRIQALVTPSTSRHVERL
jgi:hypothetical protein